MKSIFGRLFKKTEDQKEHGPHSLKFTEIPHHIDNKEIATYESLKTRTEPMQTKILADVEDLRGHVQSFKKSSSTGSHPPKLQKVADYSLPAFIKSMDFALDRTFSDDIEEFYTQIAELLRSCTKNLRGKGKYLTLVFPEEMKEIRTSLSAIGSELNEITGAMKDAKAAMDSIEKARTGYDLLRKDIEECRTKKDAWNRIWLQISNDEKILLSIDEEISSIEQGPELREIEEVERTIFALEREEKDLVEEFSRISAAVSAVFRKAEYEAGKRHKNQTVQELAKIRKWLQDPETENSREMLETLARTSEEIIQMVHEGEISLKNKEEQHFFSGERVLIETLEPLCTRLRLLDDDLREARLRISLSNTIKRKETVERKKEQIQEKHRDDVARLAQFEKELERIREQIPEKQERLQNLLSVVCGGETDVQIDIGGFPPGNPRSEPS
jgi:hypothetical protein